jgi:tRNA(fMet)-specific endonuclease VapC
MVIDSSILIQHFRSKDKSSTPFALLPKTTAYWISVITVYELLRGSKTLESEQAVLGYLEELEILEMNSEVAERAAEIYKDLKSRAMLIDNNDIFIAATCLVYDLPILTLNTKDFVRISDLRLS